MLTVSRALDCIPELTSWLISHMDLIYSKGSHQLVGVASYVVGVRALVEVRLTYILGSWLENSFIISYVRLK